MMPRSVAMTRAAGEAVVWTAPSGRLRVCKVVAFVAAGTRWDDPDDDTHTYAEDRLKLAHPEGGTVTVRLDTVRAMTLREATLTLNGELADADRVVEQANPYTLDLCSRAFGYGSRVKVPDLEGAARAFIAGPYAAATLLDPRGDVVCRWHKTRAGEVNPGPLPPWEE